MFSATIRFYIQFSILTLLGVETILGQGQRDWLSGGPSAQEFSSAFATIWDSALEPDSFSSIRGRFDATANDWGVKTNLPGFKRCRLTKSSSVEPPWEYECDITVSQENSARIRTAIANALQDSRDDWSIDVHSSTKVLTFRSQADKPLPGLTSSRVIDVFYPCCAVALIIHPPYRQIASTSPQMTATGADRHSSEADLASALDHIRNGNHSPLPAANCRNLTGERQGVSMSNDTRYPITVYFKGSVTRTLTIAPNGSAFAILPPGAYEEAAEAASADVTPFYGMYIQDSGAACDVKFVLVRR